MSNTPRTDEHLRMKEENGHTVIVSREFARQLETELAEARAEIDELNAEIDRLKSNYRKLASDYERAINEIAESHSVEEVEVDGTMCFTVACGCEFCEQWRMFNEQQQQGERYEED